MPQVLVFALRVEPDKAVATGALTRGDVIDVVPDDFNVAHQDYRRVINVSDDVANICMSHMGGDGTFENTPEGYFSRPRIMGLDLDRLEQDAEKGLSGQKIRPDQHLVVTRPTELVWVERPKVMDPNYSPYDGVEIG